MLNFDSVEKKATELNSAFVEAFVSYAAYDSRRWMMEKNTSVDKNANPVLNALKQANTSMEELTSKKVFELYASLFNKNKFEQVSLNLPSTGLYNSKKYGYETTFHSNNGDYQALDNLSRAIILKSKNPDDTYTLHVSFRGTDTVARTFKKFVTDAYLDMSSYYDSFKPLEEAVLEYAKNSDNKISKINVSGHSLGGAMVSEFFNSKEVQKCTIAMEGFTYGAPGNVKRPLYSLLPALYHTVKHGKFLQLGKTMLDFFVNTRVKNPEQSITHYSHAGDLIPRVASLAYAKEGNLISLEDVASKYKKESFILSGDNLATLFPKKTDKKNLVNVNNKVQYSHAGAWNETKEFVHKAVTFQYHDMLRYIINIDQQAQKLQEKVNEQPDSKLKSVLENSLGDILDFNEYRKKFEKVADFYPDTVSDYITNRLNQTTKLKAVQNSNWLGKMPNNNKTLSDNINRLRQAAFAQKVVNSLEQEFTKIKPI